MQPAGPDRRAGSWGTIRKEKMIFRSLGSAGTKRQRSRVVGKTLPTLHHWRHAAGLGIGFEIVPLSNFGGRKPHPIGNDRSLSLYGTFDMAGNVKEWCWNETLHGERYIAGGAYGDPEYLFSEAERRPPFQRERTFGFRCAKYIEEPHASLLEPFDRKWRDFRREIPIPDSAFALVKSLYGYERTDPHAEIVSRDTTDRDWTKERVTIAAAYGGEIVILHLFLPTASRPPYQTVVFFPGSWARMNRSSENIEENIDFTNYLDFESRADARPCSPYIREPSNAAADPQAN